MRKQKKGKRVMAALVTAVFVLGSLGGCAKTQGDRGTEQDAASGTGAGDAAIVLKIAHVNSETHPASIALEKFKEEVESRTNGAVTVDLYGNGILGGELEEIQQVIDGTLSAAMVMGASNWQTMNPAAAIEELPFMFSDVETARAAFDGDYGQKLAEEVIEPTGVKVLCYWESGFRHFTNNVRPITVPEDMNGIKFRTAQSEIRIKMFETLGATAIPMNFNELYTALQQGTVAGQENPLSIITSSNFYEVQDYLSLSGHFYSTALFIVNPDFWMSIPEEYQDVILEVAQECRDYDRQLSTEAEEEMIKTCTDNGMEVNEIDKNAFAEKMQDVWKIYTDEFGTELVDLARSYTE